MDSQKIDLNSFKKRVKKRSSSLITVSVDQKPHHSFLLDTKRIGSGGTSFVYQAYNLTENRPVALKIAKEGERRRKTLVHEGLILRSLRQQLVSESNTVAVQHLPKVYAIYRELVCKEEDVASLAETIDFNAPFLEMGLYSSSDGWQSGSQLARKKKHGIRPETLGRLMQELDLLFNILTIPRTYPNFSTASYQGVSSDAKSVLTGAVSPLSLNIEDYPTRERVLVYRDFAPKNILLHDMQPSVLLDFGNSNLVFNHRKKLWATIPFLSLELIRDADAATQASDVFSLGLTVYTLISGGNRFFDIDDEDGDGELSKKDKDVATMKKILRFKGLNELPDDDARIEAIGTWCEYFTVDMDDFVAVLSKALAPDPKDRYSEIAEFCKSMASLFTSR